MKDQHSYSNPESTNRQLWLRLEKKHKQVLGQVNVSSLWLAPEGSLSKNEAPDGQTLFCNMAAGSRCEIGGACGW